MKNLGLISLLFLFLSACSNQEEVILDSWPDGSKKHVVVYDRQGDEKMKISEVEYYENGNQKYAGKYNEQGQRQGRWSYWYENGKLWSECDYNNGLRHGKTVIYYENGQKRYEGQFTDDQNTGIWNFWDAGGNLESSINYQKE